MARVSKAKRPGATVPSLHGWRGWKVAVRGIAYYENEAPSFYRDGRWRRPSGENLKPRIVKLAC